jgi:hypothetical protein
MPGGRDFHPMARGERSALAILLLFSAVSFLPIWRTFEVLGMALSGWMMATLMVVSPILTLWIFRRRRPGR